MGKGFIPSIAILLVSFSSFANHTDSTSGTRKLIPETPCTGLSPVSGEELPGKYESIKLVDVHREGKRKPYLVAEKKDSMVFTVLDLENRKQVAERKDLTLSQKLDLNFLLSDWKRWPAPFTPDGQRFAARSREGYFGIYRFPSLGLEKKLRIPAGTKTPCILSFSPKYDELLAACENRLLVYNLDSGAVVWKLDQDKSDIEGGALGPNGQIALVSNGGHIDFLDRVTGKKSAAKEVPSIAQERKSIEENPLFSLTSPRSFFLDQIGYLPSGEFYASFDRHAAFIYDGSGYRKRVLIRDPSVGELDHFWWRFNSFRPLPNGYFLASRLDNPLALNSSDMRTGIFEWKDHDLKPIFYPPEGYDRDASDMSVGSGFATNFPSGKRYVWLVDPREHVLETRDTDCGKAALQIEVNFDVRQAEMTPDGKLFLLGSDGTLRYLSMKGVPIGKVQDGTNWKVKRVPLRIDFKKAN